MANRDSPLHYPRPGMAGPRIRLDPHLFETRCERHHYDSRVVVGWMSQRYQIEGHLALREGWAEGSQRALDLLCEHIFRFCGGMIELLDASVVADARTEIESMLPMFERQIIRRMEYIENEARMLDHQRAGAVRAMERYGRAIPLSTVDDPYNWADGFGPPKESPAAKKKATALLLKNLNQEQAIAFNEKKEFEVVGKDGKTYRITKARSFNVIGPDGTKYCGQTVDTPIEDQMLAQKLLLERDPETFFKNANVMPVGESVVWPWGEPPSAMIAMRARAFMFGDSDTVLALHPTPPPATAPAPPPRNITASEIAMRELAPTRAEVAEARMRRELERNYMNALTIGIPQRFLVDPTA